jgi:hypothetical protein
VHDICCLSHGLNLVAQPLKDELSAIDGMTRALRGYFLGAHKHNRRARAETAVPSMISKVRVGDTRWRDWLDCVQFINDQFPALRKHIESELAAATDRANVEVTPSAAALRDLQQCLSFCSDVHFLVSTLAVAPYLEPLLQLIVASQADNLEGNLQFLQRARVFEQVLKDAGAKSVGDVTEELWNYFHEEYDQMPRGEVDAQLGLVAVEMLSAFKRMHAQFQKHVTASLHALETQLLFNPLHVKEQLEAGTFGHVIWPDRVRSNFTAIKSSKAVLLAQEWSQYLTMARALQRLPAAQKGPGDGHGTSLGLWWAAAAQEQRLPNLCVVAKYVLSVSVSAANVERAHKNIAKAVPSSGERALLSDENVRYSVFFQANRALVDVFGANSLLRAVPQQALEPAMNLGQAAAAAAAAERQENEDEELEM